MTEQDLGSRLEQAQQEVIGWLEAFSSNEENPDEEISENPSEYSLTNVPLDCRMESFPASGDEEGVWQIGFGGHGLMNRTFEIRWRSPRLKIRVCLPYQFLPEKVDGEEPEDFRQRIITACSAVSFFLHFESLHESYAQNQPEAALTAICDVTGCEYMITDKEEVIASEKGWSTLLAWLEFGLLEKDAPSELQVIRV